jgi:catechol 2,3-dioxygenase-like lactoylglutathione lyase family enzyme
MDWYLKEEVEMATPYRVDPRVRAYGKARIDITRRARDEQEWQAQWHESRYPFPFTFGGGWKQCIQYTVEDYAAEIGFYIDVLGFPVSAFSPSSAQFTDPAGDFFFGVAAATEGVTPTPPESLLIQFMVDNLPKVIQELESRGVTFEHTPEAGEANPRIAALRTPHGVVLELWSSEPIQPVLKAHQHVAQQDFWADEPEEQAEEDEAVEGNASIEPVASSVEEAGLDEPVYVDTEDQEEDDAVTLVAASPQPAPIRPKPAFPATIIRRTEDLLKGHTPFPARKVRGNGLGSYPTVDESGSPE